MARLRRSRIIDAATSTPEELESIGIEITEEAPVPEVKPTPQESTFIRLVANKCNLLEPYENIWFMDGKPREVYRVTKWMQGQINAGLLKQV